MTWIYFCLYFLGYFMVALGVSFFFQDYIFTGHMGTGYASGCAGAAWPITIPLTILVIIASFLIELGHKLER